MYGDDLPSLDEPLQVVDSIMHSLQCGSTLTADQEMSASELGINISELKEVCGVIKSTYEEDEEEYSDY